MMGKSKGSRTGRWSTGGKMWNSEHYDQYIQLVTKLTAFELYMQVEGGV